jgi:hypothetical protein
MARLAVLLLALATTTGSLRLCDGWKPTPAARMACCAKGTVCPMRDRLANGHHHHAQGATQSAADTCCAASSRDGAAASVPYVLPTLAFASAGHLAPEDGLPLVRHLHVRGAESPPPDDVPRHLRLSVFLL